MCSSILALGLGLVIGSAVLLTDGNNNHRPKKEV